MRVSKHRHGFWIAFFTIVLAIVLPATTLGQGRGRGRGRGPDLDKKCGKFVNCHDARDGRWDGRGPRRNVGVFSNGIVIQRHRRNRGIRQFDDATFFRSRRLRRSHRDFDDDRFRRRSLRYRRNNDEFFRHRGFHRR
jgi:hypothetical protein